MSEAEFVKYTRYRSATMYNDLKELSARTRYYQEQYEIRWERRYKRPYPNCGEGEFGNFGTIICLG